MKKEISTSQKSRDINKILDIERVVGLPWYATPTGPTYVVDIRDAETRKVVGSRLITEEGETKELAEAIKGLFSDSKLGEQETREIQGIILDNIERIERNTGIRPERPRELLPMWVQTLPYALQVQSSISSTIGVLNRYAGFYPDREDLIDIANIIFNNIAVIVSNEWVQKKMRGGK